MECVRSKRAASEAEAGKKRQDEEDYSRLLDDPAVTIEAEENVNTASKNENVGFDTETVPKQTFTNLLTTL